MDLRQLVTDLYVRATLILQSFGEQFLRLTPLWLGGVWLGATLSWLLLPSLRAWQQSTPARGNRRPLGVAGVILGGVLGVLSPFSLLSLGGFLRELQRERRFVGLVVGFSLASPLLDPAMFIFTSLALGASLAVARGVVSLAIAWLAGAVILRSGLAWLSSSAEALPMRTVPVLSSAWAGYARHLGEHLAFSGRHYLLALLLAAWIQVLIPLRSWLFALSSSSITEILVGAGSGIPLYFCGGGAVALADGLLRAGMSRGAVLAYLTCGAATTPRALAALAPIVGRRATLVFLLVVFSLAIVSGYLLNALA